jgi:hypothetical protein
MEKLDLKRMRPDIIAAVKEPTLADIPRYHFIAVDGGGAPETGEFQKALETLYSLSYTIKFTLKKRKEGPEYTVMPLEGLWWSSGKEFEIGERDDWKWTLLICQPPHVEESHMQEAFAAQVKKGKTLAEARFINLEEGRCVQALHVGPYAEEPATVSRMKEFMSREGVTASGKHHEIYLGDPRRADPAKLKTVLRWPVREASV